MKVKLRSKEELFLDFPTICIKSNKFYPDEQMVLYFNRYYNVLENHPGYYILKKYPYWFFTKDFFITQKEIKNIKYQNKLDKLLGFKCKFKVK